eukprot:749658-Hanusia_phi.AAC.2
MINRKWKTTCRVARAGKIDDRKGRREGAMITGRNASRHTSVRAAQRANMAMSMPPMRLTALLFLCLVWMDASSAVEVCKVVDLQLVTQTGEFFLAVSFLIMGVTTVAFVLMAFKAAHEKRKVTPCFVWPVQLKCMGIAQFYFIMCYVTAISTFAYYAMLSGQGWLITPNCRQLFYVRYVDWFFTTSLIFLNLGLIVGADTGLNIAVSATMLCEDVVVIEQTDHRGGHAHDIWRIYGFNLFWAHQVALVFAVFIDLRSTGLRALKHATCTSLHAD